MRTLIGFTILGALCYSMFMYPIYTFTGMAIVSGIQWVVRKGK